MPSPNLHPIPSAPGPHAGRIAARVGGLGLLALLLLPAAPAPAYVPSADDLFVQIALQVPTVSRGIFETRTFVFDPTPRAADRLEEGAGAAEPEPLEQPERGFRQRIYWMRDGMVAIETLSLAGEPLHIYLDEGIEPLSRDLGALRHFEAIDVVHPYIAFMGGRPADWRAGLASWGIDPWQVGMRPGYKLRNLYRLGSDHAAAYLDPARLALVSLETQVHNGARPIALTMTFSEALVLGESTKREEQLYFPRIVNFFVNGRLFKQVRTTSFRADPPLNLFPLQRLRELALAPPRVTSAPGAPATPAQAPQAQAPAPRQPAPQGGGTR